MSGNTPIARLLPVTALLAPLLALGACGTSDSGSIVAASETAITITTIRFSEPTAIAEAHCAKYGRKAVPQGQVKLGSVSYKIMWGYDCVKP